MQKALETYLREFFGSSVNVLEFKRLGSGVHGAGYLLKVEIEGVIKSYVLKDLAPEGLGHDYPSDRAGVFLLALETYEKLPRHIKAIDVISMKRDGTMKSICGGVEYFLLMETAKGENYFKDLEDFSKKDSLNKTDIKKIEAMTSYLAEIHSFKKDSKTLYWRKLRDTVGHGECLMGVFDSYPDGTLPYERMAEIIKKSVDWVAKLKPRYKRLAQIHGDFHPGNIWFRAEGTKTGVDFVLLDRSRGPWGEPADDVTALTINYIFFSIKHHGIVKGPYLEGLRLFIDQYLALTHDEDLFSVVAPFYAFRGAVVANPIFYPELNHIQRELIFRFVNNVLDDERFRIERINDYLS
ncbi:MAG: phosphotransferase family protein [Thermodesulfovibrionales bacterium]